MRGGVRCGIRDCARWPQWGCVALDTLVGERGGRTRAGEPLRCTGGVEREVETRGGGVLLGKADLGLLGRAGKSVAGVGSHSGRLEGPAWRVLEGPGWARRSGCRSPGISTLGTSVGREGGNESALTRTGTGASPSSLLDCL